MVGRNTKAATPQLADRGQFPRAQSRMTVRRASDVYRERVLSGALPFDDSLRRSKEVMSDDQPFQFLPIDEVYSRQLRFVLGASRKA